MYRTRSGFFSGSAGSPHACRALLALLAGLAAPPTLAAVQDEIFGDDFEGFEHAACDSGLPSFSSDPAQYAAAMDLCQTTTEAGTAPGLISATFSLASGAGTPAAQSRRLQTAFGATAPHAGAEMVVLSTGAAAALGQSGFVTFQSGFDTGTSSAAPADWLTANAGTFPVAPGCPAANSSSAFNPIMLTLRIRVPGNARSFSVAANYLTSDFPEWVCSPYNDLFVALLDSSYAGTPPNPADKNIASYTAPSTKVYPLGVALARDDTGLFTQCINGPTGCDSGNQGTISTCANTNGLTGTGMDTTDAVCSGSYMVGGGTDWLELRGNVVPGEIIQLRLAIWDTSDGTYDSVVLLDDFRWSAQQIVPGMTRN